MSEDGYVHLKQRLVGPGGPFELSMIEDEAPQPEFRRGPHTLSEIFQRSAVFGSRPFLASRAGQQSFSDIFRRADAVAANLIRLQVARGSRLTLELTDPVDWAASFIAATKIGASPVLVDPSWDEATREQRALSLESVLRLRSLDCEGIVVDHSAVPMGPVSVDDEALVTFTSGTTREPKAVSVDHRGLVTGLRSMMLLAVLNSTPGATRSAGPPCALTFAPMHYVGGYSALIFSMMTGAPLIFSSGEIDEAFDLVEAHEVRSIGGVTRSHLLDLLDAPLSFRAKLKSLRSINYFGAQLEPELLDQFERTYPEVGLSAGYGLTETNGSIASGTLTQFRERPGVAGRLSPAACVRVVDDWGRPLSQGEVGNLEISGAFLAKSYVAASGATPIRGQWFNTGDIGYLDDQDFLHVRGRRHFIVIDGREIDVVGLERKIANLAGVRDVVILADTAKSIIAICVSPQTDAGAMIEAAVRADIMGTHWRILVSAFDSLPLTSSGKVSRVEVAKRIGAMTPA